MKEQDYYQMQKEASSGKWTILRQIPNHKII